MITHKHHIIPRHAGGTDEPSNLVEVSVEEHAELHLALYLEHGKWQDWVAFTMLSGQIGKEEGIALAVLMGAKAKGYKQKPRASRPITEETRRRISESRKGQPAHNKGKCASEEARRRMSEAKKGREALNKGTFRLSFMDGRVIIVKGITTWCNENGYSYGHIKKLRAGKVKRHKDVIKCDRLTEELMKMLKQQKDK